MPDSSEADTAQQLVNQTILLQLEKLVLGLIRLSKAVVRNQLMRQKLRTESLTKVKLQVWMVLWVLPVLCH